MRQVKERWKSLSSSRLVRNFVLFIPFLLVATVFWFIIALDDTLQKDYTVNVEYVNVPDSVTFITDPPTSLRVSVRDKGTRMAGRIFSGTPTIRIDFARFNRDGVMRVSSSALVSALDGVFGSSAEILSVSPDSIRIDFTVRQGKEVPVIVVSDLRAASGKTISGDLTVSPDKAVVYSRNAVILDTLQCVYTEPIVRRNIENSLSLNAVIQPVPGCRIYPESVKIEIPVEPLENRSVLVPVSAINVPAGESLLVFPRTVKVNYLVPISAQEIPVGSFKAWVDYNDVQRLQGNDIPVTMQYYSPQVVSASLDTDRVEYTLIR